MGLFRKKEEKETNNKEVNSGNLDFIGNNNYISEGNNFQFIEQAKVKEAKSKMSWNGIPLDDAIEGEVESKILEYTNETTPFKYYQYYQLANYFINLFKFECEDIGLFEAIKKAQLIAFFNGRAGLWWSGVAKKFIPVAISKVEVNEYDEIKSVTINTYFNFDDVNRQLDNYKLNEKFNRNVDAKEVVLCSIRSNAMSCFIWLREYVNMQNRLMSQISMCSLINNKILSFNMDSKNDNKKSLLSFLNPSRFWIYNRQSTKLNDSVKLLTELIDSDLTVKYLEIYRQTMDMYSDYIGIRNNTEYKKERNTVDEVNAEQGWFDAIEYEFFINFKLFIDKLNNYPTMNSKVTYQDFRRSNDDTERSNNQGQFQKQMEDR